MKNDELFYVGQKAIIEKNGEILFLVDSGSGPDLPGGKIQEGETDFIAALKREVTEETGLVISVGIPFYTWYFQFPLNTHPNAGKKLYCVAYSCTYVSGEVILSQEHTSYKWINKNNYQQYVGGSNYLPILHTYFNQR